MEELLRSNDPVLISHVRAILTDADILHMVADDAMSIMEGTLGILPRRILVHAEQIGEARALLAEEGVAP